MSSFGVPVGNLRELLAAQDKVQFPQMGIPCDSAANELTDWIAYARYANPKLRITIKGDENAGYEVVDKVIKTLQEQNINKFNLITDLKAKPKIL
jgi:biopolymer transport protein ExbD